MNLGTFGILTFGAPWLLLGLLILPVIWWLLRFLPPRPQTITFPPARLLLGLLTKERTPIRSPLWLTLLRILTAACIILALSAPILKAPSAPSSDGADALLVVVDNSWAAANGWNLRTRALDQLAAAAEEEGKNLYLVATADPSTNLQLMTPAQFRQRAALLAPASYRGQRGQVAQSLLQTLAGSKGKLRAIWIADDIDDDGAKALADALSALSSNGRFDLYTDDKGRAPIGITRARGEGGSALTATIMAAGTAKRNGTIAAITARGNAIAATPYEIPAGQNTAEVKIELPLELRNQVARLELQGEASAGAVYLLDGRWQRRKVGVVASEGTENAQPLLSQAHYLQKAIAPYAELSIARTADLNKATEELLARSPSIIILSDVGRLSGHIQERLKSFVEKGGMLLRFAGPRLEQGGDNLLPAPLREGGRNLGGAMTWTTPQKPMRFEEDSPFAGLPIPSDVTVSRQVLTNPATMPRDLKVWARLEDGTPLVTAAKLGAGELVFFHITANADWSTLPISGLFVSMMQRIIEVAPAASGISAADQPAAATGREEGRSREGFLRPVRLLDGFGKLQPAAGQELPISSRDIEKLTSSKSAPAGLYGEGEMTRAINVLGADTQLRPLSTPANALAKSFSPAASVDLTPTLYALALLLFLADCLAASLFLRSGSSGRRMTKAAAVASAVLAAVVFSGSASPLKAQSALEPQYDEATRFALQASLETHLAYVVTGNAEVDRVSQQGLAGLSKILTLRTAVEPGEPMGVDPARDELVFFPLLYWPVLPDAPPLPDNVISKIDAYMKQGGMIIFDTRTEDGLTGLASGAPGSSPLARLLGKLDIPPLQRIAYDHVLTKSFYLLQSFPGRWDNGEMWVEAQSASSQGGNRAVKTDGVSSIIITSNDLAAAWAMDEADRPLYACVPGGEDQREMSYRVGVNIVVYALTGNYKSDQVHVPAILERLGH